MKRLFRLIGMILLVLLGFALGFIYSVFAKGKVLLHQDAVVEGLARPRVELKHDAGQYIDIQPENAHILFIFYPGGLVRPQAYEWLGVALAPLGIRTVIPVFTADLAVTAPNRAEALLKVLGNYEHVVVGGHSLGGAMAARFVLKQPEKVHGLVLMGAFSAKSDDLSALDLPVLSLAAEHDGLATLEEIRESLQRLPETAQLEIVEGAVHSFFGRYGPQRGDGVPNVTRHQAEMDIVSSLQGFLTLSRFVCHAQRSSVYCPKDMLFAFPGGFVHHSTQAAIC